MLAVVMTAEAGPKKKPVAQEQNEERLRQLRGAAQTEAGPSGEDVPDTSADEIAVGAAIQAGLLPTIHE
eukprot:4812445-Pyramimonas_sp.AAC.1